jgi:hypothetical protein
MSLKKVEVTLTALWREVIFVEIPDNATEKDAEARVQKALDQENFEPSPDAIEIDSWEWKDQMTFAPPPPMNFPADPSLSAEWRGHRWATTGVIAIREDAPCPTSEDGAWIGKGERLVELLNSVQLTLERPTRMRFQAKFAPILRAGRTMVARWANVEGCAVLRDDGQLIALVMPYRGSTDSVDCEGKP